MVEMVARQIGRRLFRPALNKRCAVQGIGVGVDHGESDQFGLDFDPDAAWNERKQIYEHSHLIIDSTSITATAECGPDNHWTCVVAAAVFLFS